MKIRHILLMCGLAALTSCFKDETTEGTGPISEIEIVDGSVREVYDIDKNETLTIVPQLRQTNADKPLSYTWEVDGKVYSTAPELVYTGSMLGAYQCRLVVENEDGKTFFPFKLNVNSPYEEGITVLSCNDEGKSMLSFMLRQRAEGVEEAFEQGDCFAVNNPDEAFAANAADMVQSSGNLIIACSGDGTPAHPGTIYYLNEKTFVVENVLTAPEYPGFKPTHVTMPLNGYSGSAYPILCEDGSIYEFSAAETVLLPSIRLQSRYAQSCTVLSGQSAGNYNVHFWDEERGALTMLYNGYGPYCCSTDYQVTPTTLTSANNYFQGEEFVAMFIPRLPDNAQNDSPTLVVVTKVGNVYRKVEMSANFWEYDYEQSKNNLMTLGGKKIAGLKEHHLRTESPLVASKVYQALLFGDGNMVYRWNYTTNEQLDKAKVHATMGSERAVVTGMELSRDQKETYVAFYEPDEPGLNGHVWVIDTDKGNVLRKYDNVCYRPVKIMYKKK